VRRRLRVGLTRLREPSRTNTQAHSAAGALRRWTDDSHPMGTGARCALTGCRARTNRSPWQCCSVPITPIAPKAARRAAQNFLEKLLSFYFQWFTGWQTNLARRLARRSHCRPASRCSNF